MDPVLTLRTAGAFDLTFDVSQLLAERHAQVDQRDGQGYQHNNNGQYDQQDGFRINIHRSFLRLGHVGVVSLPTGWGVSILVTLLRSRLFRLFLHIFSISGAY